MYLEEVLLLLVCVRTSRLGQTLNLRLPLLLSRHKIVVFSLVEVVIPPLGEPLLILVLQNHLVLLLLQSILLGDHSDSTEGLSQQILTQPFVSCDFKLMQVLAVVSVSDVKYFLLEESEVLADIVGISNLIKFGLNGIAVDHVQDRASFHVFGSKLLNFRPLFS